MKSQLLIIFLLISSISFGQGTGEVIITEIYNRPLKPTQEQLDAVLASNPMGADVTPNEGHTEWFEIYNTTDSPVVMDGWTLTDASKSSAVTTIGSFTIEAHSYAAFSGFNIPDAQGGVVFDYFYDYKAPSFNNESSYEDVGDDSCPDGVIIQKADGTLVDEVLYDYGYGHYIGNLNANESCSSNLAAIGMPPVEAGSKKSFMLKVDPAIMNAADNDLAENWEFSTLVYDGGNQIGTPGLANDGSGPDMGAGTGEVIITEIYNRPLKPSDEQLAAALMNNPAGADDTPNEGHTEWFEIYNTTNEPVIMDGWTLTDASKTSAVTTIGSFTIAANSYAVFSGFNIPDAQGGVAFDYFYDYKAPSFNNESSYEDPGDKSCPDGVIIQKADGTLVDEVRYDYGYGEYIDNPESGSCMDNEAAVGIPAAQSSSKVSFMLNADPAVMNAADNDLAANWSFSTATYDEVGSQIGTPGLANDASTSIRPLLEASLKIFPNPAKEIIYIESDFQESLRVGIVDLIGQTIITENPDNNQIDISNISAGMYLIKIHFGKEHVVRKIVIQ